MGRATWCLRDEAADPRLRACALVERGKLQPAGAGAARPRGRPGPRPGPGAAGRHRAAPAPDLARRPAANPIHPAGRVAGRLSSRPRDAHNGAPASRLALSHPLNRKPRHDHRNQL
ncbi:hypothetical protein C6568_15910 [Melaminivora suipulveris]|uniref:Uncharacterized protein n=1 Tax=Melaminivora suipulveris TaxID=2109913 RepID=A0A2R3QFM0_9BURK|nr:hypothetical protein C6568_15910 [Melaminivora suipulveris]